MQLNLQNVSIVHTIETHRLEAYYGGALLWSTPDEEPGAEGEATEFYTATVIALVNAWDGMSNHARFRAWSCLCESTPRFSGLW
ncbi:hypothetical protein [Jannaschia sp. 2305UL9-9]|uniref:hypothetical protein n=1 Tax=Jannaschia sp. 2305UL9-9 TaxID=3121638 RepID=UPI0035294A21